MMNSLKIGNAWHLYHKLDVNIEKVSEFMYYAVVDVTSFGTLAFFLFSALINYFIFDLGADSYEDLLFKCECIDTKNSVHIKWTQVYRFRVPFDWRNWIGYTLTLILHTISCFCATCVCNATLCFLIGSIWAILTIADDITNDLHDLDFMILSNRNRKKNIQRFCKHVEQFTSLKQLSGSNFQILRNNFKIPSIQVQKKTYYARAFWTFTAISITVGCIYILCISWALFHL